MTDTTLAEDALVDDPAQPATEPQPTIPVHPLAAVFPMMDDEALDDLADDIQANGLRHPIVLDANGQLLDGRNRLKACRLAGVEPTFTTTTLDAKTVILGENVTRRHLTVGQQAMAYAMLYPESTSKGGRGNKAYSENTVSRDQVSKARFVLRHAPDLAEKVMMSGTSLPEAYNAAAERKRDREQFDQLRDEVRERMDAIIGVGTRAKANADNPSAFLDQADFLRQVRADVQEIKEHAKVLAEHV